MEGDGTLVSTRVRGGVYWHMVIRTYTYDLPSAQVLWTKSTE